jgi:hypothetical protein
MTHQLNSHDVCIQGFERLRTTREYMLAIPVHKGMTPAEVLDALKADLQCCDRGDDFDWDAADDCVRTFTEGLKPYAFADVEDRGEDDEPCYLFLYIEPVTIEPNDSESPQSISAHERHGDNH